MKQFILISSIFTAGCAFSGPPAENSIHVAAASGLYHVFTELGEQYEQDTGTEVIFSFGSTGQFTQQIREGASYDLFAAADESYIDRLIEENAVDATSKRTYAYGRIGFMYDEATWSGMTPDDLLSDEIEQIAIANPSHAPYGLAARQALESWDIWDNVEEKLVYGDNIRQTVQYAESGNVDAAIAALSLAHQSELSFEMIEEEAHEPLPQTLAVPLESEKPEEAGEFIDYIFSDEGQEIMESYGFILPEENGI